MERPDRVPIHRARDFARGKYLEFISAQLRFPLDQAFLTAIHRITFQEHKVSCVLRSK